MAARNRPGLSENTRQRIKTTMIVKRLQDHIVGDCELSATQIRAAEILLNKTLPSLQGIEQKTEITERSVISAQPLDSDEFKTKYSLESAEGTTDSIN